MIKQAEKYKSLGWQLVPQIYGSVKAKIKWSELYASDKIEFNPGWFKGKTNLAVLCGEKSNIIVLDVDNKEHRFWKELKPLIKLIETPMSRSNKGFHLFFKYDDEFKEKLQYKEDGVNIFDLQTNKTLITLPPSLHKNGTYNYKWVNNRSPFEVDPIVIPEKIKNIIKSYTDVLVPTKKTKHHKNDSIEYIENLKNIPILDVANRLNIDIDKELKASCFLQSHSDTHKSLSFDKDKNFYHCFGCEDNSGDTIKLVQNYFGSGFKEACNWINNEFHIRSYIDLKISTKNKNEVKIYDDLPDLLNCIYNKIKPIDVKEEFVLTGGILVGKGEGEVPNKFIKQVILNVLFKNLYTFGYQICKTDNDLNYIYNGSYWLNISKNEVENLLSEVSVRMGINRYKAKDHLYVADIYKQFLMTGFKRISPERQKIQINLRNCVIEIIDGKIKIKKFSPNMFFTYRLSFNYNSNSDCPMFKKYLDRVVPDKDDQKTLQEYTGYIFTKNSFLKLEKILLLYGSGHNGKSVFHEIIQGLIGDDNICEYTLTDLEEEHYRAEIVDKLLNYSSELGRLQDKEIFKKIASGEKLSARQKYGKPFMMADYCRFMFNANTLPSLVDHNIAYFRRFLIIHFDQYISKDEKDVSLAKKIKENELCGVFNWALEGLNRLVINQEFTVSNKSNQLMSKFREETDNVAMFINSEFIDKHEQDLDSSFGALGNSVYASYKEFCFEAGYQKLGRNNFYERFCRTGVYEKTNQRRPICLKKKESAKLTLLDGETLD